MRILVDLDETVIDLVEPWLARYNVNYDDDLTPNEILSYDITKYIKPECGSKIDDYLTDPDIYDDAPPIAGALTALDDLRDLGHEIVFVTVSHHAGKIRWLADHDLGGIPVVVTTDKTLVAGEILIDDNPLHVIEFSNINNKSFNTADEFLKLGILFSQPWNLHVDYFPRALSWGEIVEVFQKMPENLKKLTENLKMS